MKLDCRGTGGRKRQGDVESSNGKKKWPSTKRRESFVATLNQAGCGFNRGRDNAKAIVIARASP